MSRLDTGKTYFANAFNLAFLRLRVIERGLLTGILMLVMSQNTVNALTVPDEGDFLEHVQYAAGCPLPPANTVYFDSVGELVQACTAYFAKWVCPAPGCTINSFYPSECNPYYPPPVDYNGVHTPGCCGTLDYTRSGTNLITLNIASITLHLADCPTGYLRYGGGNCQCSCRLDG
jgi:hypothetical protein